MSAPDITRCPHCFGATKITPCPHCGWQPGQDNPPPALALGRVLDGRYRIGQVLGHGGFGITYLAWDDNLHLRLAIKEYLPRDCATRAPDGISLAIYSGQAGDQFAYGLDRFLEEARALAHFDQHPGIVTVKNFFRAHGTGYCVMDYVDGITLRDYLEQQPGGRISFDAALKLLMPVMDALRAVHKEGLLHRDIAPDNIYLTQDGRIKLLDFGAARFAAGEHSKSLSVILKPGYAPEEQYRTKGHQGPWTDVYGLAATLLRAITGQVPPESLDRLDNDELVPPSRLGIAITPSQEATLLKALAVKARERYQSMAELQQAWRAGSAIAPPPVSDPSGPVRAETADAPTTHPQKRSSTGLILTLGVGLLLVAMLAWFSWPGSPPPPPALTGTAPRPSPPTSLALPATTPDPTPAMVLAPTAAPSAAVTTAPAAPSMPETPRVAGSTLPTATPAPSPSADAQAGSARMEEAGATPTAVTTPPLPVPAHTPAPPPASTAPGEKATLYFAAELPPTANIPPEAPLCYKYLVAGPEEQLRKLKNKYPGLYQDKISTNPDGSKNLVAKRQDESGKEIDYFYSTSPEVCNDYQQDRLQTQTAPGDERGSNAASLPGGASAPTVGASPNERYRFVGKDQGIVEDIRTKLQWQRCSLGQTWTGATCSGEAKRYEWDKAMRIAPAGWRLPTKDELASLVYCSSGEPAYWKKPGYGGCQYAYSEPTIWSAAFPNTPVSWFWSSSPNASGAGSAWYVNFGYGYVSDYGKGDARYVRLVRGGQ